MHSAKERFGVDFCLTSEDSDDVPECPHGPMLLFERFFRDGKASAKYYACSACRDKKDCPFFQWKNETISSTRRLAHNDIINKSKPSPNQVRCNQKLQELFHSSVVKDGTSSWVFCHTCNVLLLDYTTSSQEKTHFGHNMQTGETIADLRNPSVILKPKDNVKTNAQFLFSNQATQYLVSTIRKLGFKKVLCLGTPRLHERIQLNKTKKVKGKPKIQMESLLLDIDYRYGQFFPEDTFGYYNMFNHYFFDKKDKEKLENFLNSSEVDDIVLVMDPPFGGLVDVLATTVNKIWSTWLQCSRKQDKRKELPTMWIFPYFMEPHIQESLPTLKMLDYKVDYENHPHFKGKQDKGSKRDSPVRIFTNIDPATITMPTEQGYKLCKICTRYVAAENVHCPKCNSCTSKDGRTYIHCDQCNICVKPGRVHCSTCNRCELARHDCNQRSSNGCHICGDLGHKRRDCPTRLKEPKETKTKKRKKEKTFKAKKRKKN